MAYFIVECNEETAKKGKDILEKFRRPGEKTSDAFERFLNIIEEEGDVLDSKYKEKFELMVKIRLRENKEHEELKRKYIELLEKTVETSLKK